MSGRHTRGRHSAAVEDLIQPLDDLIRDTGGLPAIRHTPDGALHPDVAAALRADTWATPPGDFDTEVLEEVRLGQIHDTPRAWKAVR